MVGGERADNGGRLQTTRAPPGYLALPRRGGPACRYEARRERHHHPDERQGERSNRSRECFFFRAGPSLSISPLLLPRSPPLCAHRTRQHNGGRRRRQAGGSDSAGVASVWEGRDNRQRPAGHPPIDDAPLSLPQDAPPPKSDKAAAKEEAKRKKAAEKEAEHRAWLEANKD